MKNIFKRIITFLLTITLLMQSFLINNAQAVGVGIVNVAWDVIREFHQTKQLDLKESKVNIVITPEELASLRRQAEESAFKWYRCVRIFDDYNTDWLIENTDKYGFKNKYWQDNVDLSDLDNSDSTRQFLEEYDSAGSIDNYLKNLNIEENLANYETRMNELIEILDDLFSKYSNGELTLAQYNEMSDPCFDELSLLSDKKSELLYIDIMLKGKIEEIYNDKLADLVAQRVAGNLPYEAEFEIQVIPDEELSLYKVDGMTIKKGNLYNTSSKLAGKIDFNAEDQFYDEVLRDGVFNIEKHTTSEDDRDVFLRDGRDFIDHVLFIAQGYLRSSDDSQVSFAGPRGGSIYPGNHCLLEVCDSLGTYRRPLLQIPGAFYVQTFNLHLNPSVTYSATGITADLISNIEFNENGKITKISKPLPLNDEAQTALFDANSNEGVYRFKYVEKVVKNDLFEDGSILIDDKPRFLDFIVRFESWGNIVAEYQIGDLENAPTTYELEGNPYDYVKQEKIIKRTQTTSFNNRIAVIDLKITKTWEDDNNKDGIRPDLNTFVSKIHLYADDKEIIIDRREAKDYLAYKETKEEGNAYTIEYKNLPKYNLEGKEIKYTIKEDNIAGYKATIEGYNITNKQVPEEEFEFNVFKVDSFGNGINNATLELLDNDGTSLDKWLTNGKKHKLQITKGDYTIREVDPPFGFETIEDVKFNIDDKGNIKLVNEHAHASVSGNEIRIEDPRDLLDAKTITFAKVDEKGNPLAGAKIKIMDDNNNVFDEWVSDGIPHVEEFLPSTYWFVEIEAPNGYQTIERFKFEIDAEGNVKLVKDSESVNATNKGLSITNEKINPPKANLNKPKVVNTAVK